MSDMRQYTQNADHSETTPSVSPQTPLHYVGQGRTALWVLLSVVVGFFLPVCSCAAMLFASFAGLSLFGGREVTRVGTGDAVAIVRVEGTITSADRADFETGAVSGVVINDLKAAQNDSSVKAIVLRIDSPGGSATGSAQIHEVIRELEKPVVVSMASLAASGGYYISAPADHIMARADTLTGSLGVIMTLFNAEELLDEVGVDVVTIVTGPNKAMGSVWEELTPEHRQILEELIDESYDEFVRVVAEGRGMSERSVIDLADGRVFSGRQALANGLVDELGNLDDAIAKAAELSGITGQPRIVEYDHAPSLRQFLTGLSVQLNRSESERILDTLAQFATPSLEYRYVGPDSQ